MKTLKIQGWFFLVILFCLSASAQTGANLSVLVPLNSATNGSTPVCPLTPGPGGEFYGTTYYGGTNSSGALFKLDTNGALTTLYSFDQTNGGNSRGSLVIGTNGTIYGLSALGGSNACGQIWSLTTSGVFSNLFSFNGTNGYNAFGGLTQGNDNALYGVTSGGGTNAGAYHGGAGTIFKITLDGKFTSLFSFSNTNGNQPVGGLTLGRDGNFYGTTYGGGASYTTDLPLGNGTVYRMSPQGAVTVLVSFNGANGYDSQSRLVEGLDGAFYGTADDASSIGEEGTVFKVTKEGVLTNLLFFDGVNGEQPQGGLIQASDGFLYGTTTAGGTNHSSLSGGAGTIYRIATDGSFTTLFSFSDTNGYLPTDDLVQGRDGLIYGTTSGGTGLMGNGGIFGLSVPGANAPKLVAAITSNAAALTWIPLMGRTYQVEYITDLTQTNWMNLSNAIIATNSPMTVTDAIGAGEKIYRVVLLP